MPNIPNTSQPGLSLLSQGDGSNGSYWGDTSVNTTLAQASYTLGTTDYDSDYLVNVTYFPASMPEQGTITSVAWTPQSFLGVYPCVSLAPNGGYTNVDTTAGARVIVAKMIVAEVGGTNYISTQFTVTIPQAGPGQSYTFTGAEPLGGTINQHGTAFAIRGSSPWDIYATSAFDVIASCAWFSN